MINEDDSQSRGSFDSKSPLKILTPVKLLNDSWLEEVNNASDSSEHIKTVDKIQINKPKEIKQETTMNYSDLTAVKIEYAAGIVKQDTDMVGSNLNDSLNIKSENHNTSTEFEIEFFDSTNEAKFDRLVKDKKIKTTFKRRLSGNSNDESRSTSPSIGNCSGNTSSIDENTKFYNSSKEGNKFFKNYPNHNDSKKPRYENQRKHSSNSVGSSESGVSTKKWQKPIPETNPEILERRQKQIDYGKNTIGYDRYLKQVPKSKRAKNHPWTPPKNVVYSRRAWDGLIKIWRKELHVFDIDGESTSGQQTANNIDDSTDNDSDDDDVEDDDDAGGDDDDSELVDMKS